MKKVTQTFTKGINRRIDRSQSTPDRFESLQNARIFKRGDTLHVARIDGFQRWPTVDSESSLAVLARPAEFDTTGFQKGTLLEFVDGVDCYSEELISGKLFEVDFPQTTLVAQEIFDHSVVRFLNFQEQVTTQDRLPRRPKVLRTLSFQEGIDVASVGDNFNFNSFIRLSFTEGIEVRDTPVCET